MNVVDEPFLKMNENIICKTKLLLAFLLITIALLIAVSIYCYLIKYKAFVLNSYYHFMSQIIN